MNNTTKGTWFNDSIPVKKMLLMNPNLSIKAKGAMAMILLMKDIPEITESDLCLFSTDGLGSVRSAINELEKFGYLKRERLRNKNGQFQGVKWTIVEEPK